MIVDGKLEKKCTNGQTSFYIKKLEHELSRKTDTSILAQKSPSPIICRIRTPYEKLRELTTETKAMKFFVIEQILLVKNSVNDKPGSKTQLQEKSNEKCLIEEIRHLREENKTKNCIIQTLMENQINLLKSIKSIDGNHSEMFSTQHAQSDNFITPRYCVKNRDAHKSFTIDTRNQFQPLENVIEEQSNNNELNMAQEATNNPRNDPTMSGEKSVEKLPSSTDPADNNFVSSDVDNCINNIRRSEKENAKKTSQQSQRITKILLIVGYSIVKNIEPYKIKKSTKYVTKVKLIPGTTTEGMIHHVKDYTVDFASDIVLLHRSTNDLKRDLAPQKIAQNILTYLTEVREMFWFLELLIEVMIIMLKCKK